MTTESKNKKPFGLRKAEGKKFLMEAGDTHYLVASVSRTGLCDYPNRTFDVTDTSVEQWGVVHIPEEFI